LQPAPNHDVITNEKTASQSSFSRRKSFSTAPVWPSVTLLDEKINFQLGARASVTADGRAETQPTLKPARRRKYQAQAVPDV